ncbi:FUSC family protein [Streptomyces sp. RB6PN25]|uniref:FUSC family protein n=1 Tax=Streptomyces humicola TaxID=2953240 RepID=A0ABT1PY02_9ACTN|nr:FUSC family protein [Streptomyces humicola]MCQ4082551.1 FUSC family protein [Streptomyces humicola]
MTKARQGIAAVWVRLWDGYAASDPGLLRLTAALRTVGSIVLTLAVLAAFGLPASLLVAGAMAAMVATFAITEPLPRDQAVTLALGLPTALLAVTLGALLDPYVIVGDLTFLALIFAAVYVRRFGDRGTSLGLIGFQIYFVSLFVHARMALLPHLYATLVIAVCCAAVARFALVPATPERTLSQLRRAFRARLAQVVQAQEELVGEAGAPGDQSDKTLDDLRRQTARLHECALMIQGRLETGTRDEATAAVLQRRIADAEIAAERLGVLLLKSRHRQGVDTLTLHLPPAPELSAAAPGTTATTATPAESPFEDETTRRLRRDLRGLHLLITRAAPDDRGTGLAVVRNRLLGYRDDENLPQASLAVQDVFRAIGEAARAVLGLRVALDGLQVESEDDSPETIRSREELEAEDVSMASMERAAEEEPEPTGLDRPTTRSAFQVTVGSALAIAGGELLSTQRWYWAVLTCWVVFLNTSSTGEILVKGYRRVLGTITGVVAGLVLAGLVGHHTWIAFVFVLVCVFGAFFTAPLSYVLMSFFITAMLGLLYTLLNTYSLAVLELRVEETALGAACGMIAALLVLPVRTHHRTDQQLREVLSRLSDVSRAAVDQLSGRPEAPEADLLDLARELDTALDDFRRSTRPLTHPITPLRVRRRTARYIVALLETCAYHARSLAATAELVPSSTRIAADPRLAQAGERIERNLRVLIGRLEGEQSGTVESGASVAASLVPGEPLGPGTVAFRVLRHVQRLDEGVVGLARPLGVPTDGERSRRTAA